MRRGASAGLGDVPTDHALDALTPDQREFVLWARRAARPLTSIRPTHCELSHAATTFGDAKLVALTEAVHGAVEPLQFRNTLFEHLVREKGFTAIAIESGIVESRIVHDFVRGGPGDLGTVLTRGISWTFDRLPQNRELIRWLREYNCDPRHARKINFYGFDMSGSPGEGTASRGADTALTEALNYLDHVDKDAATDFRSRFRPFLEQLSFNVTRSSTPAGYEALTRRQRDTLTATIADMVTLFECREGDYMGRSGMKDYAWGHRSAIAAREVDSWLRHVPLGFEPLGPNDDWHAERLSFLRAASDVRDRTQAENLKWIVNQEGAAGKILIFSSRYHMATAPLNTSDWWGSGARYEQAVAGTYLRRHFGPALLTIGNVVGHVAPDIDTTAHSLSASSQSVDSLARAVGVPRFLLDLRGAPGLETGWLSQEHALTCGSHGLKVVPGRAFDILLYIDSITPPSAYT